MRSCTCANRMRLKGNRILRQILLPALSIAIVMTGTYSTYAYTEVKGTVTCTSGKVRKEASTTAAFAYGVHQDEEVTIINETNGTDGKVWYQIKVGDSIGYIRSDLVKKSTASTENGNSNSNSSSSTVIGTITGDKVVVRTAASTKSDIAMVINKSSQVTIVSSTKGDDGKTWYQVAFKKGTTAFKGYIRSDLLSTNGTVNASADATQASQTTDAAQTAASGSIQVGKIKGSGINVRKTSVDGEVICRVTSGQAVTVTEQVAGSDGNVWYKISFINNMTPQTGYIRSDFVDGVTQTAVANETAETGNSISASNENAQTENTQSGESNYTEKSGAVNGINVNVRKEPVTGSVMAKLSSGQTVTVKNERSTESGQVWYEISYKFNKEDYTGWILGSYIRIEEGAKSDYSSSVEASIKGIGIRVRESAVNGTVVEQLSSGIRVKIIGETEGSDGNKWYNIAFTYNGAEKTGYVRSDFVNILYTNENTTPSSDTDFEGSISALPDSYKANLRALHEKYPNWQFEVVDTGLDWNAAITAECSVGKNLVPLNSISSWKSTEPQAYNWTTNSWYGFDGGTWASASKEIISYYMDPRNFLDESGIFQFEKLDNLDYQNEDGVKNIVANTFLDSYFVDTDGAERSYISSIAEAAREAGISPYHLAARIIQEQGIYGTSQSISGIMSGYEGYFNYFNIGAYAANGKLPVENGLIYAMGTDDTYSRPWNTRYRSILGSAKYVAQKYVKMGQNTLYFEKFNVVNSSNGIYSHQYMSNIQAASSESARMRRAYADLNTTLVFRIPYYKNMPESPCEKPTGESNPNNYLSSLYVEGFEIAPGFSAVTDTYFLTVDNSVSTINVCATAVSDTSSIGGIGTVQINEGTNELSIVCKAQNGTTRTYKLVVQCN